MSMKKTYISEFKAQVVREILSEQKTITEIASEYGVHQVQLSQWKKAALENLNALCGRPQSHQTATEMAKPIPVRMDDKGRLMVPRPIREALHAEAGDVFYIQQEADGSVRIIKGGDPFDMLTEEAIREDDAGKTIAFDDILRREGISLDE